MSKIHRVCSKLNDSGSWGTLHSPNSLSPLISNEDCWCRLSAENNQRIVLSVIKFHIAPIQLNCTESGFYLQSEKKRSKECTILRRGHYYISSSKQLYLNFNAKQASVNSGFWIIYETTDGKSNISLECEESDQVPYVEPGRLKPVPETNFNFLSNLFISKTPKLIIQDQTNISNRITTKSSSKLIDPTNQSINIFALTNLPKIIPKNRTKYFLKFTDSQKFNETKELQSKKLIFLNKYFTF